MASPPTGTVTFLFTDIEGSTKLAQAHAAEWEVARQRHHAILQATIEAHRGYTFQVVGDAFCAAFATVSDGLQAALAAQRALHAELWGETPINVRMGLHTGAAELVDGNYRGYLALSHVQRLVSAASGGQVLVGDATEALMRERLPADVALRDLGAIRLKDFPQPEHIYQLVAPDLPADFLPLKSLDGIQHNLPLQLTSFIGRKQEIDAVEQLLAGTRLLTLTGSGGTGKTRLSLELAGRLLEQFSDGAWVVELAPLAEPAFVTQTAAAALRVPEQPGQSVMQTLTVHLRDKELLLVLDNCEHLIPACRQLAMALLQVCPRIKILATSREALGIAGETTYRVPSLSIPAGGQALADDRSLATYDSVRLFVERAAAVQSRFTLGSQNAQAVAQICTRLDGIPLAIELAAARVRMLTATQIAARLDDAFQLLTQGSQLAPPRHQTLRAAMDWSYDLLQPLERVLFRRLAVFAGGFTLEAAEAIGAGPEIAGRHVLDLLSALVDKSLVSVDEQDELTGTRYRQLEPIRQYAREQLATAGESTGCEERHLGYFLELAEAMEPQLRGARQKECLDRLEREHDNLRAALEWAKRQGDDERTLRLGGALYVFWRQREYHSESEERLGPMLALTVSPAHEPLRAKILVATAYVDMWTGNLERAKSRARESIALSRKHADLRREGEGYFVLGFATWQTNDYQEAKTWLERALALGQQCNDQIGMADALHLLGHVAQDRGDHTQARTFYLDCFTRLSSLGDRVNQTLLLADLGTVSYLQANYPMAQAYIEQDLALCREIGNKIGVARALNTLGDLARCNDDYARAEAFYKDSLALFTEVHYKAQTASVWHNLAHVRLRQGEYAQAAVLFKRAWEEFRTMGDKKGVADCLAGLAGVAAQNRQPERAARLLGASGSLVQAIGTTLWPANRIAQVRCIAQVREQMDAKAYDAAWNEGKALTMEQAITLAEQVSVSAQTANQAAAAASAQQAGLTAREVEVLRLVAKGYTDAQVAQALVISPRTVGRHLSSIYSKLDVTTRTAAARVAVDRKLT